MSSAASLSATRVLLRGEMTAQQVANAIREVKAAGADT